MDISENKMKSFSESFFSLISKKPWNLKSCLESVLKVWKSSSHPLHPKLMGEFPLPSFLKFLNILMEDLVLLLPPIGDQTDHGQYPILFPRSSSSSFENLLIEASSNVEVAKKLYACLESFAVQLPGIGIAPLLVSSPLYRICQQFPMSTYGMTVIQDKECADVASLASFEEKLSLSSAQEKLSEDTDLFEESQPKKRKRETENTTAICSSKFY